MVKWLVGQGCGKPLTTVHVKRGEEAHFSNRTVHCSGCGKLNVLSGDYMAV